MDELPLTAEECRVLGSLIEKAATTPDQYPLSSNGLRTACNQKTARDPVVSYDERLIDATLLSLRDLGLARTIRGAGQRVFKHKHIVDEAWGLSVRELAVLGVLMLRGPQTAGELRTRTERAHGFAGSAEVDAVLDDLARRDPPLVQMVGRQPGQKDVRWVTTAAPGAPPATSGGRTVSPEPQRTATTDVARLGSAPRPESGVEDLRLEVAELRRVIDRICTELGISIDEGAG